MVKGLKMRASKFLAWITVFSLLFAACGEAQAPAPAPAPAKAPVATKKTTTPKQTVASLNAQAQKYLQLLSDVDVSSDPDVKSAVFAKWVDATCQSKRLQFQQSGVDASLGGAIYQNCTKRLSADPAAAVAAATSKALPVPATPQSQGGGKPTGTSSTAQTCVVIATPAAANGSNSTYSYNVQCSTGVTPNSMAIVTPLVTNPSGFALEQGIASQSNSSDTSSTTFTFTFSPTTDSKKLSLSVPTTLTEQKSATYYIVSGAAKDLSACQKSSPSSPVDGCSIGAVSVPVPKTPPTPAANTPDCTLNAGPVDTSVTGSSRYNYTIHCASGKTPSLLGLQAKALSSSFTGAQAIASLSGITFDSTDVANGAVRLIVPSGGSDHTFQIVVPTASTVTTDATYYITTDSTIKDEFVTCQPKSPPPPPTCSSGIVPVPVPAGGSLGDNVPAGLDITKGNTLFTQSTVGLNIASASGTGGVQANFSLNFFLNAPLWGYPSGEAQVDCKDPIKAASAKGISYCRDVISVECAGFLAVPVQCNGLSDHDCQAKQAKVAQCTTQVTRNEQQKDLRRQFRDPLGAKLWVYFNPTLSTIPQTGLTVSDLVAPSSIATTAINNNANTDVTKLVQAFNFEQGLEWKLWLKPPYMPDAFGRIPREGSSANRLGLFLYGGYGIGVPVNGTLNPTTIYDVNADLYALYNLPNSIPGTPGYDSTCGLTSSGHKPPPNPNCGILGATPTSTPYKYLALQQVSSLQFFQSYYAGLRLKTFTYNIQPCKNQPAGAGSGNVPLHFCSVPKNIFPGLYDIGIGQDQAITGYKFHGPVLRAQADYSLPFYTPVHVFGSIRLALNRPQPNNVAQYVLTPDTSVAATSPATYLQPVPPPTRSLYSFGIGIDLIEAIKKGIQGKTTIAPITPTQSTYAQGSQTTVQFEAPVTGATDTTKTWQLTGPEGGPSDAASIGSISSDTGLYTLPTKAPTTSLTVTIKATAKADGSKSSTIQITITPPPTKAKAS